MDATRSTIPAKTISTSFRSREHDLADYLSLPDAILSSQLASHGVDPDMVEDLSDEGLMLLFAKVERTLREGRKLGTGLRRASATVEEDGTELEESRVTNERGSVTNRDSTGMMETQVPEESEFVKFSPAVPSFLRLFSPSDDVSKDLFASDDSPAATRPLLVSLFNNTVTARPSSLARKECSTPSLNTDGLSVSASSPAPFGSQRDEDLIVCITRRAMQSLNEVPSKVGGAAPSITISSRMNRASQASSSSNHFFNGSLAPKVQYSQISYDVRISILRAMDGELFFNSSPHPSEADVPGIKSNRDSLETVSSSSTTSTFSRPSTSSPAAKTTSQPRTLFKLSGLKMAMEYWEGAHHGVVKGAFPRKANGTALSDLDESFEGTKEPSDGDFETIFEAESGEAVSAQEWNEDRISVTEEEAGLKRHCAKDGPEGASPVENVKTPSIEGIKAEPPKPVKLRKTSRLARPFRIKALQLKETLKMHGSSRGLREPDATTTSRAGHQPSKSLPSIFVSPSQSSVPVASSLGRSFTTGFKSRSSVLQNRTTAANPAEKIETQQTVAERRKEESDEGRRHSSTASNLAVPSPSPRLSSAQSPSPRKRSLIWESSGPTVVVVSLPPQSTSLSTGIIQHIFRYFLDSLRPSTDARERSIQISRFAAVCKSWHDVALGVEPFQPRKFLPYLFPPEILDGIFAFALEPAHPNHFNNTSLGGDAALDPLLLPSPSSDFSVLRNFALTCWTWGRIVLRYWKSLQDLPHVASGPYLRVIIQDKIRAAAIQVLCIDAGDEEFLSRFPTMTNLQLWTVIGKIIIACSGTRKLVLNVSPPDTETKKSQVPFLWDQESASPKPDIRELVVSTPKKGKNGLSDDSLQREATSSWWNDEDLYWFFYWFSLHDSNSPSKSSSSATYLPPNGRLQLTLHRCTVQHQNTTNLIHHHSLSLYNCRISPSVMGNKSCSSLRLDQIIGGNRLSKRQVVSQLNATSPMEEIKIVLKPWPSISIESWLSSLIHPGLSWPLSPMVQELITSRAGFKSIPLRVPQDTGDDLTYDVDELPFDELFHLNPWTTFHIDGGTESTNAVTPSAFKFQIMTSYTPKNLILHYCDQLELRHLFDYLYEYQLRMETAKTRRVWDWNWNLPPVIQRIEFKTFFGWGYGAMDGDGVDADMRYLQEIVKICQELKIVFVFKEGGDEVEDDDIEHGLYDICEVEE